MDKIIEETKWSVNPVSVILLIDDASVLPNNLIFTTAYRGTSCSIQFVQVPGKENHFYTRDTYSPKMQSIIIDGYMDANKITGYVLAKPLDNYHESFKPINFKF